MPNLQLAETLQRRASLAASAQTNTFRLIHRAGDGFPHLAVDKFAEVLVAHLYSGQGTQALSEHGLLAALTEQTHARAVYVKRRPAQASTLSETERAALAPATPFVGEASESLVVRENGLKFLIQPGAGLSVGLFLDMRELRAWVREQAAGKTVLNCFAYTCGFGVAALAGGAARAVNVDAARPYLEWGQRNTELNGFAPDPKDFISGDVFDWLKRFGKRGQTFDMVIVDPPPYSTTKETRFSIQRDYADLVARAARVTARGGWLIACANAAELSLASFKTKVRAGLREAGITARLAHLWHEPEIDFPLAPGEKPYLKIGVVQLADKIAG